MKIVLGIFLVLVTGCAVGVRKPAQIISSTTTNSDLWPLDTYNLQHSAIKLVTNDDLEIPLGNKTATGFIFQEGNVSLCNRRACGGPDLTKPYCSINLNRGRKRKNGDSLVIIKKSIIELKASEDILKQNMLSKNQYIFSLKDEKFQSSQLYCGGFEGSLTLGEFREIFGNSVSVIMEMKAEGSSAAPVDSHLAQ